MHVKKQHLELDMEKQTISKLGKEYAKAVYCTLFNFYVEYITWNARLEELKAGIKIVGRNINNFWYVDRITLMAESEEEIKSLLMKVNEEREKADLKFNIKKLRSWHLVPSLHGKIDREEMEQWQILYSWAPKSLWIVTAAMKLKDTCSLKEKL